MDFNKEIFPALLSRNVNEIGSTINVAVRLLFVRSLETNGSSFQSHGRAF